MRELLELLPAPGIVETMPESGYRVLRYCGSFQEMLAVTLALDTLPDDYVTSEYVQDNRFIVGAVREPNNEITMVIIHLHLGE